MFSLSFVFWLNIFSLTNYSKNIEVGRATIFGHKGDSLAGGKSPCLRIARTKRYRRVRSTDNLIAHRTLPCGTFVLIENLRNHKKTIAIVGDHGPYGACLKNSCKNYGWVIKRKHKDPGKWRGIADLTPRVAKAIGHRGYEKIRLTVLKRGVRKKPLLLLEI